jgi:hypothetical protein
VSGTSSARVFFGMAVPFGVTAWVSHVGYSTPYKVGVSLLMGVLAGGIALWMQRRTERRLAAQGIDPGDLAPEQARSEEINADLSSVYEASRRAVLKLKKSRITRENSVTGEIDAKTGLTFRSVGETISVRITGDGPRTTVRASSKPLLPTIVMDDGKGVENVTLFFRSLHADVDDPAPNHRWSGRD